MCPLDTVKTVIMVIVTVTGGTMHHNGQRPADTGNMAHSTWYQPCITLHLVTTLLVSYALATSTLRAN